MELGFELDRFDIIIYVYFVLFLFLFWGVLNDYCEF